MSQLDSDFQDDPQGVEIAATLYDNQMVEQQAKSMLFDLRLTESERKHPLWLKIETQLTINLAACRVANDENLPPLATERLRGKIEALKEFLQFAEEPTVEHPNDPDPGY